MSESKQSLLDRPYDFVVAHLAICGWRPIHSGIGDGLWNDVAGRGVLVRHPVSVSDPLGHMAGNLHHFSVLPATRRDMQWGELSPRVLFKLVMQFEEAEQERARQEARG